MVVQEQNTAEVVQRKPGNISSTAYQVNDEEPVARRIMVGGSHPHLHCRRPRALTRRLASKNQPLSRASLNDNVPGKPTTKGSPNTTEVQSSGACAVVLQFQPLLSRRTNFNASEVHDAAVEVTKVRHADDLQAHGQLQHRSAATYVQGCCVHTNSQRHEAEIQPLLQ